jgi:hypothetical protein
MDVLMPKVDRDESPTTLPPLFNPVRVAFHEGLGEPAIFETQTSYWPQVGDLVCLPDLGEFYVIQSRWEYPPQGDPDLFVKVRSILNDRI